MGCGAFLFCPRRSLRGFELDLAASLYYDSLALNAPLSPP
ncbi:hypothetical protein OIHEL45_04015 [Sulfitobacter indolifex HEL-45]|uniref:Uncharacterized protein n=1 Tax=Sulfitobacter indolifex HEL-45 TaxID=391624 RepID=A0ABP2DC98_9RHOB|nr:hypothetical protein OIHEL45_04015 [Sulfitobacter indolifex HEL-45]